MGRDFTGAGGGIDEPAPTAQQNRMAACKKEGGDRALQGEERKKFMRKCLKG